MDTSRLAFCLISQTCTQYGGNADLDGSGIYSLSDLIIFYNILVSINDNTIMSSNLDGNPMNTTVGGCYCVNGSQECSP